MFHVELNEIFVPSRLPLSGRIPVLDLPASLSCWIFKSRYTGASSVFKDAYLEFIKVESSGISITLLVFAKTVAFR